MMSLARTRCAGLLGVMLVATLLVGGCAGRQRAPGWVKDPTDRLDPETYFVAVGIGMSSAEADLSAKLDLMEQIRGATSHEARDTSEYVRRVEQAGGQPEVTAELLELGSFEAASPLVGQQIVERWTNQKKGRYYALGAVNKALLVKTYETEMRMNAALSNRLAERAEKEEVTLRRFSELRTALVAAIAYNDLRFARAKLGEPLLGYDDTLDPPDASASELRDRIAELRASVAASIESRGPEEVPLVIETELKSALQRLNVPVRTDATQGDVRLLVTFAVLPVNQTAEEAKLVNWRLSVEVVEDATGRSLSTLALDGKTGSKTLEDAKAEATRLARIDLRTQIDDFLNKTLFEQALNTN